ncbi:hydrogenase/urease maturation nickel metallochaperone HypA [Actinocorallia populi]|uniref:hydrogenase/urease maturation nickel metallochaperone HypA n=1 Tax=Actinocorallia populi TaxID=2079200 RepID=UPI000D089DCD|nr:hydrogenase/urease maturation nickel metallochaperone HypA [Actinocorallia populi]
MHEMGLCDAIAEAVLKRAGGRRVRGVRVRISGHPVDPEVIDQGYRLAAAGTPAADALLEVVQEPGTVRCRACGGGAPADDAVHLVACPRCGGLDVEVAAGSGAVLESITVDEPAETSG